MPEPTEFRILGPVEAVRAGRPLALGGPRQRALLAALVVEAGAVVPADRLAEIVWEGRPPEGAPGTLRSYVSRLRSAVGDAIEGRPPGYALHAVRVDARRFEELLAQARVAAEAGDHAAAAERLRAALSLWRGPALADVPALHAEAVRLDGLRVVALEERIAADLELGRHGELVPELEALVEREPLRERLWGALMLALYRSGRQADALAAYRRARAVLDEQLGLDPSPELRELERRILGHDVAPVPTAEAGNLPAPVSVFVGRAAELEDLCGRVGTARLTTLVGIGGAGKTRLALEVAARVRERHPDGVWLVELAGLADPAVVESAVAGALGVADRPDRGLAGLLADRVRGRRLLVVLDNCEHVLGGAARAAALLLRAGVGAAVLATSREPLGIAGEHVHLLAPLELDAAVDLYLDRAPAHRRPDRDTVAALCRELDALPLAVELAAARAATLSPAEIRERLDDRLRFLRSVSPLAEERHRTLHAMVGWSHDLLAPDARELLARLSVCAGGWRLDAAEAIAGGDVLDTLDALVRASLVTAADGPAGTRYGMLETVRRYAAERLDDAGAREAAARRHAEHFAERADAVWEAWDTAGQVDADRAFFADADNVRAALAWAFERGEAVTVARLARAFGHIGRREGLHEEAGGWIAAALDALGDGQSALRADLLSLAGLLAVRRSDFAAARTLLREAVGAAEAAGAARSLGRHLYSLGYCLGAAGDAEGSAAAHRRAVEVLRAAGDLPGAAWSLGALADLALAAGRPDEAQALLEEERALAERAGVPHLTCALLASLADLALARGDLDAAGRDARASLDLAEAHDHTPYLGVARHLLGRVARRRGELEAARAHLTAAIPHLRRFEGGLVAAVLEELAGVEADAGRPATAARLLGAAEGVRDRSGAAVEDAHAGALEAARAAVRDGLGAGEFEAALAHGRGQTPEQAVAAAG